MKERPILFNGPMVRALLAGTKTQTRRAVKPQPAGEIRRGEPDFNHWIDTKYWERQNQKENRGIGTRGFACTYGQPGDRLWVRESWSPDPPDVDGWGYTAWAGCREGQIAGVPERFRHPRFCNYAADWLHGPIRWTPSIHMPRWASRITLEITSVRVERLQDISIEDAKAEGAWGPDDSVVEKVANHFGIRHFDTNPRLAYQMLWEQINGPGSWDANPWVWVVEFRSPRPC